MSAVASSSRKGWPENCLTYALRTWRFGRPDSHLVIRRSHWGWFPHFAVVFEMADGSLIKKEYVPTVPRQRWWPPLFFRGIEKTTIYHKGEVCDARKTNLGKLCISDRHAA